MPKTNLQMTNGRLFHRFDCIVVLSFVVFTGFGVTNLKAEFISAVEKTGSSELRGMIDGNGSVFDRLLSWTEFGSVNIISGAHANSSVPDLVDALEDDVDLGSDFVPTASAYQGTASNSLDSSGYSSSVSPVDAAILECRSCCSDPVLLLYWRGMEFFRVPDAPSSGLFRPPRTVFLDSTI